MDLNIEKDLQSASEWIAGLATKSFETTETVLVSYVRHLEEKGIIKFTANRHIEEKKQYRYKIYPDDKILSIIDLKNGKSVTNDIEFIINTIAAKENNIELCIYKVIYRDTVNVWDGFDNKTRKFISLNLESEYAAIEAIKKL